MNTVKTSVVTRLSARTILREFGMTRWYMRTILACMLALFVVAEAERDAEERRL
jgi:hypothetical protein